MKMDEMAARLLELESTVQELRQRLDACEERLATDGDGEQFRARGFEEGGDRRDEVAALEALNTTLGEKLEAIKNLEPARTVRAVDTKVGTALQDLYDALAAPDWDNPLGTPGAQPTPTPSGGGTVAVRSSAP